jgi:hypothetical protein
MRAVSDKAGIGAEGAPNLENQASSPDFGKSEASGQGVKPMDYR